MSSVAENDEDEDEEHPAGLDIMTRTLRERSRTPDRDDSVNSFSMDFDSNYEVSDSDESDLGEVLLDAHDWVARHSTPSREVAQHAFTL